MTIRETLANFGFVGQVPRRRTPFYMLAELSRRETEANIRPDPDIDIFMKAAAPEGRRLMLLPIIYSRFQDLKFAPTRWWEMK